MKVALEGGPCVGKSKMISMLEARGFAVVHELATDVINDGGPDPCTDHEAFQYEVLRRQLTEEARFTEASPLFLDRGAYAGIPYREIYGRRVPDFFAPLPRGMYDVCFLLDPLPWEDNGVRYEDPTFTCDIQPFFARVYENNDVPVVRVPVADPEARLEFILRHVGKALGRTLTAKLPKNGGNPINTERKAERRWFSIPTLAASMSIAASLSMASTN